MPISVLIVARNEEQNIADCINSVAFADEVVVIDDYSEDRTGELAKNLGARVLQRHMNGDWGAQQTYAVKQAKSDWILFLDADERISKPLAEAILNAVKECGRTGERFAYWMQRENVFHNNRAVHGSLRPDWVCRLMPTEGSYVEGYVHPAIITPYKNKKLSGVMLHYTYDNWQQYFGKFNNYTTLAARKYFDAGKPCGFWKDIVLRPFWAFIKIYFINLGFLDGRLGWILGVYHYFYTMTKYVKLYYLYKCGGKL